LIASLSWGKQLPVKIEVVKRDWIEMKQLNGFDRANQQQFRPNHYWWRLHIPLE
jgi:hypothetical protein